jgi:hypothetical protein
MLHDTNSADVLNAAARGVRFATVRHKKTVFTSCAGPRIDAYNYVDPQLSRSSLCPFRICVELKMLDTIVALE